MDNSTPSSPITPIQPVSPVIQTPAPKISVFPIPFVVLILILLTATGVFAYQNKQLQKQIAILQSQPTPISSPSPTPLSPETTPTPDSTTGWTLYTDIQNRYSVKYPANFKTSDYAEGNYKGVAMAYIGESQKTSGRTETELSDGIVVKTIIINDPKKSIEQYAQEQKSAEGDAASQIVTSKLGGQTAYEFTANGWWGRTRVMYSGVNNFVIRLSANINGTDTKISDYEKIVNQILSTFKFINESSTPTPTQTITPTPKPKTTYTVPTSWKRLTTQSGLNLCMPPKWEVEAYDHLIFNRDEGYKPSITYITNLPYSGGSRREAYFAYWVQEYPDVKQLVSVADTDINGNSALTIHPANSSDPKTSPEGLTVVWYSAGKLWKAGLSGWNMTNTSQASFLKDFYTMISCSL